MLWEMLRSLRRHRRIKSKRSWAILGHCSSNTGFDCFGTSVPFLVSAETTSAGLAKSQLRNDPELARRLPMNPPSHAGMPLRMKIGAHSPCGGTRPTTGSIVPICRPGSPTRRLSHFRGNLVAADVRRLTFGARRLEPPHVERVRGWHWATLSPLSRWSQFSIFIGMHLSRSERPHLSLPPRGKTVEFVLMTRAFHVQQKLSKLNKPRRANFALGSR